MKQEASESKQKTHQRNKTQDPSGVRKEMALQDELDLNINYDEKESPENDFNKL